MKDSHKEISTKELADIIAQAVIDEPYFSKEKFVPKIRTLITAFRLQLYALNYNKTLNPTQTAKLIRSNEIMNLEREFWKKEADRLGGGRDNIRESYERLNEERKTWYGTEEEVV